MPAERVRRRTFGRKVTCEEGGAGGLGDDTIVRSEEILSRHSSVVFERVL